MRSATTAGAAAMVVSQAEPFGRSFQIGSAVIPAIRMVRLENTQPSVYTQELAGMVFGTDTLAWSCLKGSSFGAGKEALPKDAVDDIAGLTESAVRAFLRRKCNNSATALKKAGKTADDDTQ
uniref:Putative conserved secreted protein n=1 Tax=Amblyomma tuberculatum TaxID=48802 RepID=A0A6M2E5H5_9ACAR